MMGNIALINEEGLNQDYLNSHADDWGSSLLTTHHQVHTDMHHYMID